jgi:hypothetical protein
MATSRLQIRHFHGQYLISAHHPAPEAVKERLDRTITHVLAPRLSNAFSSWFSENDPSVWVIRRLDIDVALNAKWDHDELTRAFTARIARTLGDTLHDDVDTTNVIRFSDRTAYLASFLSDLAAGAAWGRWYYRSFDGLRLLPASAALRTAICDQPDFGRDALLRLNDEELLRVLRALTSQDARRILDSFAESAPAVSESRCFQAAWSAWKTLSATSSGLTDQWPRALQLFLTASRGDANAGGLNLKAASLALLRLAGSLDAYSIARIEQLCAALSRADLPGLYASAGSADAEILLPLLRCPSAFVREVIQTMVARRNGLPSDDNGMPGPRHTPFGGIFLLLPILDELPLADATRGWPHADEAAAITLVRFLLVVKCCARQHAAPAFWDPLLRDLLLIPPGISPQVIRDWQSQITPGHLRQMLSTIVDGHKTARKFSESVDVALSRVARHVYRSFARRLPGFAKSSIPYLFGNFLDFSASIQHEPLRCVVRIGRPPLHFVLRMTGNTRQTYRLSWLDERPFVLFEEA